MLTGLAAVLATLGVVFVLLAPGYAITRALFPAPGLGAMERLLFSLGLSIGVAALGGLLLNWSPYALQAASWIALLGAVTLVAAAVGMARRRWHWTTLAGHWDGVVPFRPALVVGLAITVAAGALVFAYQGSVEPRPPGFAQLWMLPAGTAQDSVQIGVNNMEETVAQYRLVLEIDNRELEEWSVITLAPGRQWQATVGLPVAPSGPRTVAAVLYRLGAPAETYRRVQLTGG
jgi:uncharacterized membrane protein